MYGDDVGGENIPVLTTSHPLLRHRLEIAEKILSIDMFQLF